MESRPEKGLHIYFNDEEPRTHAELPRSYRDLLMRTNLEQYTDLVHRSKNDCDHARMALLGDFWTSAVSTASKTCRRVRTQLHLAEEGDGESVAVTVQDTVATLNALEIVAQDTRAAKRRGEVRAANEPQLPDFGDRAWPRDRVLPVQTSFPQLRDVLIELAWRLVDHVAVQSQ
jgi:hypothetical protein